MIDRDGTTEKREGASATDACEKARSRNLRIAAFSLALGPLILFAIASQLEPSSSGLGTHQQLGLPPCSMRMLWGIRCPGCGMTTSWAHFIRGDFSSSWRSNAGGFLLAIFGLTLSYFSVACGVRGELPAVATQRWLAISLLMIAGITLAEWGLRLAS